MTVGQRLTCFFLSLVVKDRAPLGMKTTNLKANNLQTPAPFGGTTKQPKTNRRQSTAQKIRKAAPVTQQAQTKVHVDAAADDVPDIEYMPPKPRGTLKQLKLQPQKLISDELQIFRTFQTM